MLASLSPRRRALVYAVAALAVGSLLVGALLTGALTAGRARPHAASGRLEPYADQRRPGTILLVPGFGGRTSSLGVLATDLRAAGRRVTVVDLGDARGPIEQQAAVLERDVEQAERAGAPSVDLVGYSNGGVVVRYWVRHHDGVHRARRVITLGSPHHGTQIAALAEGNDPRLCPQACREVAPDSAFLAALNTGDETPDGPGWISIYSADDGTIIPATSSRLAGAVNYDVEQLCPQARIRHADLPRSPIVLDLVDAALDVPVRHPRRCS